MLFTNLDIRHSITSLHVIIRNNIVRIIYIYQAIRVYNGKPKMLRHVVEDSVVNSALHTQILAMQDKEEGSVKSFSQIGLQFLG